MTPLQKYEISRTLDKLQAEYYAIDWDNASDHDEEQLEQALASLERLVARKASTSRYQELKEALAAFEKAVQLCNTPKPQTTKND